MRTNSIKLNGAALLAAAMTFGAGVSYADSLVAKVPFSFRIQEKELPAGEITISQVGSGAGPLLMVRNWQAKQAALVMARTTLSPAKQADKRPHLVFQCGESGCALSEIWGATSSGGGVEVPPDRKRDFERATFVYLNRHKGSR